MPSTILSDNGVTSNTSGIKVAGSNDGILELQTTTAGGAVTTAMTINTSQAVTFAQTANLPNTFGFKNRIINGGMDIAQRGTSFTSGANNDDAYVLDRFYILSDGNDAIDVTQTTTVPTGAKYSIGLDVETTNKKFGIAQIIENANCFDAIGGAVTLSFQAKVSATTKLDNVKCAIVAWSGTADSVTSDIISAWEAEGTNPTLIANATYENTPANLNVTTSFATYSVTANVDTASTSNIIVFIWSDVTDTTAGDFLYITNIQLEKGSTATSFDYRDYGRELILCYRYFYKITGNGPVGMGRINSPDELSINFFYPVTLRTNPTVSFTNVGMYDGTVSVTSTGLNNWTFATWGSYLGLYNPNNSFTVNRPGQASIGNGSLEFRAEL
jgi:hypothetical protein